MPEETVPSSASDTESSDSLVRNLRVVSLSTLLSRVLGLVRDILMAALFGAGTTLDVFIVAFFDHTMLA